jgi:hypothetical protein
MTTAVNWKCHWKNTKGKDKFLDQVMRDFFALDDVLEKIERRIKAIAKTVRCQERNSENAAAWTNLVNYFDNELIRSGVEKLTEDPDDVEKRIVLLNPFYYERYHTVILNNAMRRIVELINRQGAAEPTLRANIKNAINKSEMIFQKVKDASGQFDQAAADDTNSAPPPAPLGLGAPEM